MTMRNSTNGKQILVIDDEPAMIALLDRILSEAGFKVIHAGDGVFGLSLVRENDPDLILLDIKMPGPDGILTLERIREFSDAPVIMVTGLHDEQTIQKAINSGADDYISKPFKPNELVARVKAKLRRS